MRIVCQPEAPAGRDIALDVSVSAPQPQPAPAPVSKQRSWTAAEKAFTLEMLPVCGNLARTIAWLVDNRYSVSIARASSQRPANLQTRGLARKTFKA